LAQQRAVFHGTTPPRDDVCFVTAKPARVPQQFGHVLELSSVSTWFWLKNVSWVQGECVKTKKTCKIKKPTKAKITRIKKVKKKNIYNVPTRSTNSTQSSFLHRLGTEFLGCGAFLQLSSVGSARTMVQRGKSSP